MHGDSSLFVVHSVGDQQSISLPTSQCLPVLRPSQDISLSLERQRYSISSRSQLNEQLGRLLCHLLSPLHDSSIRAVVLRQFWAMDDARYVFNFVLTSTLKKTVRRGCGLGCGLDRGVLCVLYD